MNKCQVLVLWISRLLFKEACRIGEFLDIWKLGNLALSFTKVFFFLKVEFV